LAASSFFVDNLQVRSSYSRDFTHLIYSGTTLNAESAKDDTMNVNYSDKEGISVRTSVMLFAAGWLLLALVALPLPSGFF
jgi:hypothetical protein